MRNGEEAQTEKEREARGSVVKVSGLRIQPAWGDYIYDVHRWQWIWVTEKQIITIHNFERYKTGRPDYLNAARHAVICTCIHGPGV